MRWSIVQMWMKVTSPESYFAWLKFGISNGLKWILSNLASVTDLNEFTEFEPGEVNF